MDLGGSFGMLEVLGDLSVLHHHRILLTSLRYFSGKSCQIRELRR